MKKIIYILVSFTLITLMHNNSFAVNSPGYSLVKEWPKTDFHINNIKFDEIMSGGPPKDGIPAIDNPKFKPISEITNIEDNEPVITLSINEEVKAYPIQVLMFHEIVNDTVGGKAVSVTFCPLCNASIVFDRNVGGKILDFGTTGKLRLSDMVMYDRQTESWWQQFTGTGIVGEYTNKKLKVLPSRIESFALFKKRFPDGKVLVPNNSFARNYGRNPYANYDTSKTPFLYMGKYDEAIPPLARVVAIGKNAWPLSILRKKKNIKHNDITISWTKGQNSSLDTSRISKGRDIGNVVATKNGKDVIYHVPFAFAFKAFYPEGIIHSDKSYESDKK